MLGRGAGVELKRERERIKESVMGIPGPIELDTLERPLCSDRSSPGPVQHEGDLTEVV